MDAIMEWFHVKEYTKSEQISDSNDNSKYLIIIKKESLKERIASKFANPTNLLFIINSRIEFLSQFPIYQEHICSREKNVYLYYNSKDLEIASIVAVSFIMSAYGMGETIEASIEYCEKLFKHKIEFQDSKKEQLEIYFKMGSKIDSKHNSWLAYVKKYEVSYEEIIKSIMAQNSKKLMTPTSISLNFSPLTPRAKPLDRPNTALSRAEDSFLHWKNKTLNLINLPSPSAGLTGYVCKICSKKLFSDENIIPHNDIKHPINFSKKEGCENVIVEPMRWMGDKLLSKKGKIQCYGCKEELGGWQWKSWKCQQCNTKHAPSFFIHIDKLAFRDIPIVSSNSSPSLSSLSSSSKPILPMSGRLSRKFSATNSITSLRKSNSNSNNVSGKEDKPDSKKDRPLSPEKGYLIVTCFDELPKDMQKLLIKAKISKKMVDDNWDVARCVLRFHTKKYFLNSESQIEVIKKKLKKEKKLGYKKITINEETMSLFGNIPTLSSFHDLLVRIYETEDLMTYIQEIVTAGNPKDHYRLTETIGRGGFGRVYIGKDKNQNKYAVKKLPNTSKKEMISNLREILFMKHSKHKNIVQYHESLASSDEVWVAMEFMEGGTLKEAAVLHQFTESQLGYIAKEVLCGLQYLHENGLAHRDLKPGNIMLTTDGIVKIIDFGLCEEVETTIAKPRMVGSPFWMPPEIILREAYGPKVDVWSLGVTLVEVAEGARSHHSNSLKVMFDVATIGMEEPFAKSGNWSSEFKDFISKMLTKDQFQRWSVEQLLKHSFLKNTSSRKSMERILRSIFIQNIVGIVGI